MRFSIKRNIASLDTFKVLAIFMIIILHTEFHTFIETNFWYTIYFVIERFARFAVPFFFLSAGFLFAKKFKKNKDLKKTTLSYLKRILLLYLVWKLFYLLIPPYPTSLIAFWKENLLNIIDAPYRELMLGQGFQLWFLIALALGILYIALTEQLNLKKLPVPLALAFYFLGLVITLYAPFFCISNSVTPELLYGFLFAPIFVSLGYVSYGKKINLSMTLIGVLTTLGFFLYAIESIYLNKYFGIPLYYTNFLVGTIPFAFGIFLLALKFPKLGEDSGVNKLAVYSLGIYVVHIYVRNVFVVLGLYSIPDILIFLPVIIFIFSLLIVMILSRIKYIKKIII